MDEHSGHRKRLKDRYLRIGLDAFEDYEALELLLFYAMPRRDTKSLAKQLLCCFGSLPAVLDASVEELKEAGLTENAAILLHMQLPLYRKYEMKKAEDQKCIRSSSDAGRILCAMFRNEAEESIRLVSLDAAGKIIRTDILGRGDINSVHFSVRKIAETALANKAVSVILAHNHPAGSLTPSREDVDATESAKNALDTLGIRLLDHFIVAGENYRSLREEGYI